MPDPDRASRLATRLRSLPLLIDEISVEAFSTPVPSYPDEPRPSSLVRLRGAGHEGLGEHVGWTVQAHRDFGRRATTHIQPGETSIGTLSARVGELFGDPYDRAAVEGAAIDLALRQAGSDLAAIAGLRPGSVRYVESFAPGSDPAREIEERRGGRRSLRFKIDTLAAWDDQVFASIAETRAVDVLDYKRGGELADHQRASRWLPEALLEDPGPEPLHAAETIDHRRSVDGPFLHPDSLVGHPDPRAANIKPARMGGILAALDAVAYCAPRAIEVYFGGMFELGPARRQLRDLAALLSADGPNDIAPIVRHGVPAPEAMRLPPSNLPGFGRESD